MLKSTGEHTNLASGKLQNFPPNALIFLHSLWFQSSYSILLCIELCFSILASILISWFILAISLRYPVVRMIVYRFWIIHFFCSLFEVCNSCTFTCPTIMLWWLSAEQSKHFHRLILLTRLNDFYQLIHCIWFA